MASGVKVAAFAGLIRVFVLAFDAYSVDWQPMIAALAVLTLITGSVLAVVQTDVKRMMAYSSINHAGFVLVGGLLALVLVLAIVPGLFAGDLPLQGRIVAAIGVTVFGFLFVPVSSRLDCSARHSRCSSSFFLRSW